jgi:hypothetical protein
MSSLLLALPAALLAATATPPLLFIDDNGRVTAEEIAAFRSHVESLSLPTAIGTSDFAYFQTGTRIEGMGHVYRMTHDKAILDTMLRWTDCVLAFRNDPVTGTLDWTGERELIWKPEEKRTGAEQGIIASKISYAALLILESPELWDQTVASGDPHGYGVTYKQRAERYVAEMDRTEDTFLMKWFLRPGTDQYAFPSDPRYDGGKDGRLAPYNQGWMFSFNKARLARCHEILGGQAARAARYREIVQKNLDLYTKAFVPVSYDGAPAAHWPYDADGVIATEDVGHAQMGLQGLFNLELIGGYANFPDRERFANTILYRVLKPDSLQWTFNVDGTGRLEEEIRPSYVLLSRWAPALYALVVTDKAAAGRLTTDVETVAYLLWAKQARHTGHWTGPR